MIQRSFGKAPRCTRRGTEKWGDGVERSAAQAKAKEEGYPTIVAMQAGGSAEVDDILALETAFFGKS